MFWRQCCWDCQSSRMLHNVAVWVVLVPSSSGLSGCLWLLHLTVKEPPSLEVSGATPPTQTVSHPRKFKSSKNVIPKWLVLKCNKKVSITFEGFRRLFITLTICPILLDSDHHLYSKTTFQQKLFASPHAERRRLICLSKEELLYIRDNLSSLN
jgi:hypothetical protein